MISASSSRRRGERALLIGLGFAMAALLLLPLLALFVTISPHDAATSLTHRLVAPALLLSLLTCAATLVVVIVLGTPLAWVIARSQRRAARTFETLLGLPIVIPPAVAGVALLLAFGRRGLFASWLPDGWSIAFTPAAVVLAQVVVAAPFFLQAAIAAFRRVDDDLVLVARSLGATPFVVLFRVAIPVGRVGLQSGIAMTAARALGEFGATLMFAGNLSGSTQTMPLAIYVALESDLKVAQALSIGLVLVSFALLLGMRARDR